MTHSVTRVSRCWVYRSPRRAEMYLYLREPKRFDLLPDVLLERFGHPELVMELDLQVRRKLAREDVSKVLSNLQTQGYHLQMPPRIRPDIHWGY